jgi:hypothetical protein
MTDIVNYEQLNEQKALNLFESDSEDDVIDFDGFSASEI